MNIVLTVKRDDFHPVLHNLYSNLTGAGISAMLTSMGDEFRQLTVRNFGAGGGPRAFVWPALSPRYQKRINYYGPPTLIRSGALVQSLHVEAPVGNTITVATGDLPYATVHQFGGGNNIPARPYFPVVNNRLTTYAENRIVSVAERFLTRFATVRF